MSKRPRRGTASGPLADGGRALRPLEPGAGWPDPSAGQRAAGQGPASGARAPRAAWAPLGNPARWAGARALVERARVWPPQGLRAAAGPLGVPLPLALLTALALALRLWRIGEPSFWTDEAYTALVYTLPLPDRFARILTDDLHPPLYPLLIGLWAGLFGTSEAALRLPSAVLGAAVVPALFALARRLFPGPLGRPVAWSAAALAALSPFLVYQSQEARNASLLVLLAVLSGWALVGALASGRRRDWLLYVLLAAALLYTHYSGFLVLAAQGLWLALATPRGPQAAQEATGSPTRPGSRWGAPLLALAGVALLFLPWLPFAVRQVGQYRTVLPGVFWLPTVLAELAAAPLNGAVPPAALAPLLPALGAALGALVLGGLAAGRSGWRGGLYAVLGLAVPLGALLAIWSQTPKIQPRYAIAALPCLFLLVGWGLAGAAGSPGRPGGDGVPNATPVALGSPGLGYPSARPGRAAGKGLAATLARAGRAVAALGLLAALLGSLWALPAGYAPLRDDYRALVAEIVARAGPNDVIVTLMELDEPVRYYSRGALPIVHLVDQLDFAATAERLNAATAGRERVWLVGFGEEWADPAGFVRHSLAERAVEPPFERWYGLTRLAGYRLDPARPFSAEPALDYAAAVRFEHGAEFVGWSLWSVGRPPRAAGPTVVAGQSSTLDLHWRAVAPPVADFKVVATVEDADGRALARVDRTPSTLLVSPPRWPAGLLFHAAAPLELPATTPPGRYRVRVGAYDPATLRELAALGADGRPVGTRVAAGEIVVLPPAAPPPDDAVELPRLDPPADFALGGAPTLRLLGRAVVPSEPREGEPVELALAWRALRAPGEELEAVVRLRGPGGVLAEVAFDPTPGYPTSRWSAGDLFVGRSWVALPPEVEGGRLEIELGLRDRAGRWLDGPGGPFVPLGSLAVRERPVSRVVPPMERRLDASFGGQVRLLGYDLDAADARPGGSLRLTLYWQALGRIERRQKVFNHLVDERDRFVGQEDAEPLGGALPTTAWKPGEVVADVHVVPVRADAAPGVYWLKVGLYDPVSGARLAVSGSDAGSPPTFALLGAVEVRP